ncbi:hypothetical protein HRI_003154600 [Hibiscus trionum]|uniref:Uncharacterized protein n=1 Tax=Hibiscus trionum TaxID=183268 RepID=A0A9W7IIJ3_HIBTR|nr:hypothetical protein HRI_003154600 [Hibiscus trionum]
MCNVWEAVVSGMGWVVRDGCLVDFWYDEWLASLGPLAPFYKRSGRPASCPVISFVSDGYWDVQRLDEVLPEVCIQQIIAVYPPSPLLGHDRLGWRNDKRSIFTVKSAYNSLVSNQPMEGANVWKMIWRLPVPQRIRAFIWLAFRGSLLTNKERTRRHMADDPGCSLCGHVCEDELHVLRDCVISRGLWRQVVDGNVYHNFYTTPLHDWLYMNLVGNGIVARIMDNWNIFFAILCWKIWQRRNRMIFDPDVVENEDMLRACLCYMNEVVGARTTLSAMVGPPSVVRRGEGSDWKCPPATWVKLNVDGAVNTTTKAAAIGGVCRTDGGDWLFGFNRRLGCCSVLNAELWAVLEGLRHAWRCGFHRVEIESDSREAVDCVVAGSRVRTANALVIVIEEYLKRDWEVAVKCVGRESNAVADWFAKKARDNELGEWFYETPPMEVQLLLENDQHQR